MRGIEHGDGDLSPDPPVAVPVADEIPLRGVKAPQKVDGFVGSLERRHQD